MQFCKAHFKDIMKQFQHSKKLSDIKDDNFKSLQEYLHNRNLTNARLKFNIWTEMVEKVAGYFKTYIY